ncbi:cryptochrome/photolyase family protein [Rhizosphaericola mali]|uniref:Deoxyribodipyrimidine photo-lyase n=1 Tax=Rhizosphaericola mali TaxID=2545455 RepID=A0A5P2G1L7_9BACT|nr:deoxyribodipyrimidine photo-lyase [Rhizosphaericola mali]QES89325.1 deoxyribodipyrimidine photo-lyase [Rhizosphaericola mali]
MQQKSSIQIFWFRRDLRWDDNAGLFYALKSDTPVFPIFIFDTNILDDLPQNDPRVHFIHIALEKLQAKLTNLGSGLNIYVGKPLEIFQQIQTQFEIKGIFCNRDYELYAIQRDHQIKIWANEKQIAFHSFKDQVIFEGDEILKSDGSSYSIFTPYSKKWLEKLNSFFLSGYDTTKYKNSLFKEKTTFPSLAEIGFEKTDFHFPKFNISIPTIERYDATRDIPSLENGTTHLGIHLRFGTISIRQLASLASKHNATYLKELIWRDFYQMILQNFSQINKGNAFRAEYDLIQWRNNEHEFESWKNGQTGFPIVDAGMRELNATGHMHNRVRMIVASFLTKNLLIDWRWGEAYFAEKLLDFDFAANNGGWQWAAGSGCDAAPYFRIFNPTSQTEKFDPKLIYIKKWIPEIDSFEYPQPIIDFKESRERCLSVYKQALQKN